MSTGFRFDVLVDKWVPLEEGGQVRLASFRDLLTGAADARDLLHPRDDLRFFSRMLLSALTQALVPARDTRELRERIERPLAARSVDPVLEEARQDFELLGRNAFLQGDASADGEEATSQLFLDVPSGSNHVLFRPPRRYDGVCAACAVPAVYGIQAFSPSAGRGKSPGVRGSPPVTTLVWQPSVRRSIWANTLTEKGAEAVSYPPDGPRPWRPAQKILTGERIGLLQGLFWQPRSFVLRANGDGACSVCGREGARLHVRGFAAKSKVEGGFFPHPYSPSYERLGQAGPIERHFVHLRSDRPAWVGLADLLTNTAGGDGPRRRMYHAAPVVHQWLEQLQQSQVTLLVFCYSTDKAKILSRFAETFPLSLQLPAFVPQLRWIVERAEEVLFELRRALRRAHSKRREDKGGFWLSDAESAFWQRSERPFWDAIAPAEKGQGGRSQFLRALTATARELFREHTEASALDNTKQALIAAAQRSLSWRLRKLEGTEVARV